MNCDERHCAGRNVGIISVLSKAEIADELGFKP
jgi:hypothetical protein